jgi:para-nitrobenzyl esterase
LVHKEAVSQWNNESGKEEKTMSSRRLFLSILFWALVLWLVTVPGAMMGPATNANSDHFVAATDNGPVVGLQMETMKKFLGIPYAVPPVGDLRWQPPQPAARWDGVRDATQFANHCPQIASPFGQASTTEDCLYLNVYTPVGGWHKGQGHPVMVWIHGGALVVGESDDYNPTKLVENEDVVVVTLNYRLGFLGFLAHPALSAETNYGGSGDYGFMDQQAALEWVQRNIKNFGGDPDNVTIFGESAGGLSVHTQLASPEAAGLFHQAIVESGAYFLDTDTTPLATAEAAGIALANSVGCTKPTPAETAACLRALPVTTLLAHQPANLTGNVDNKVLRQPIGKALQKGEFNRVPVMEGSNHDEWRLFVALNFWFAGLPIVNETSYEAGIAGSFGVPVTSPLVSAVLSQYPLANYPGPTGPSIALGAVGTDGIFACNSRTSIRRMAKYVPVFAYEFNDENAPELFLPTLPVPSFPPYGAAHASEIQYILGVRPFVAAPALTPAQVALSDNMVSYWGNFARSGNPNSSNAPEWPQYNVSTDLFQSLIPPTPETESGFATDHKCAFWKFIFPGTAN